MFIRLVWVYTGLLMQVVAWNKQATGYVLNTFYTSCITVLDDHMVRTKCEGGNDIRLGVPGKGVAGAAPRDIKKTTKGGA